MQSTLSHSENELFLLPAMFLLKATGAFISMIYGLTIHYIYADIWTGRHMQWRQL